MKKPKGYSRIVVDNQVWFWKVGKRFVHAKSESGKNVVDTKENVPAKETLITEDIVWADDDYYEKYAGRVGETIRYFTPELIAEWIKGKS